MLDSLKITTGSYLGQSATPDLTANPVVNELVKIAVAIVSAFIVKLADYLIKRYSKK